MKKISDRTYLLWTKIFQTFILVFVVILFAIVFIFPVWYDIKDHWHESIMHPVTKVSCTYDVSAKEKTAYVAGKTAAYQHMLASQCRKLNAAHSERLEDCNKMETDSIITDRQYGQSDEPQD